VRKASTLEKHWKKLEVTGKAFSSAVESNGDAGAEVQGTDGGEVKAEV